MALPKIVHLVWWMEEIVVLSINVVISLQSFVDEISNAVLNFENAKGNFLY